MTKDSQEVTLISVNPLEFIKRNPEDDFMVRRGPYASDILSSFADRIRLCEVEEEDRFEKMFSMLASDQKSFAESFFTNFHPIKLVETFLKEPIVEQVASSRLMPPVLCNKMAERIFSAWKNDNSSISDEAEPVILALLCSGHVTLYHQQESIIEFLLFRLASSNNKSPMGLRLFLALFQPFVEFSDLQIIKLVSFLNNESNDLLLEEDSLASSETNALFCFNSSLNLKESCLLHLFALPKSVQLMKSYLSIMKEKEVLQLLGKLMKILRILLGVLKRSSSTGPTAVLLNPSHKCVLKAPKVGQILDWISILVDSQYPLCLMQPSILAALEEVQAFLAEEVALNGALEPVSAFIKPIIESKLPAPSSAAQEPIHQQGSFYSILPSNL